MGEYSDESWRNWWLAPFGVFYFGQGYALSALGLFMPIYLVTVLGVPFEITGLALAVIGIPWMLKIIFGAISDSLAWGRFGRRRPYIILMALLAAIGWALIPFFPEFNVVFAATLFLVALATAFADTTIDGFAVDITPSDRRGTLQGMMWGGRAAGSILGALATGIIAQAIGWPIVFYLGAIILLVMTGVCALLKEPAKPSGRKMWSALKTGFSSKGVWLSLLFTPILTMSFVFYFQWGGLFIEETVALSLTEIGLILALMNTGAAITGFLGGPLADKIGLRRAVAGLVLVQIIGLAALLFVQPGNFYLALVIMFFHGLCWGLANIAWLSLAMASCPREVGGTFFSIFAMIFNIGTMLAVILSIFIKPAFGWSGFILTLIVLTLISEFIGILAASQVKQATAMKKPPLETS
jgi:PAT family beta-lactamase induction signal transducer AmpG